MTITCSIKSKANFSRQRLRKIRGLLLNCSIYLLQYLIVHGKSLCPLLQSVLTLKNSVHYLIFKLPIPVFHSTDSTDSQLVMTISNLKNFISSSKLQYPHYIVLYFTEHFHNVVNLKLTVAKHKSPSVDINICSIFEARWLSQTLGSFKLSINLFQEASGHLFSHN